MQSVKTIIEGSGSAALHLGKAATGYVQAIPVPTVAEAASAAKEAALQAAQQAAQVARDHPYAAAVVGGGIAIAAAPAMVAAPALAAAGFGAEGIIGTSMAASVHGMIGNVVAQSAFATLTSAGMGGYGVATVNAVVSGMGGAAAAVGALGGVTSWWTK